MTCPSPLLDTLTDLVGADPSPVAVSRALNLVGNLLPNGPTPLAPSTHSADSPAGGACYSCAAYFTPALTRCPACGSLDLLCIPGPPDDLVTAGRALAQRLPRYPGLPHLRLLQVPLNYLVLSTLRDWLLHLHQHARRWTAINLPSVPLLSAGELLVIWNTASPQLLFAPPPDLSWYYHADSDY